MAALSRIRALAVMVFTFWSAVVSAANSFLDCDIPLAANDTSYEGALCYYQLAARQQNWQAAADHLQTLSERYPQNLWLTLVRGYTLSSLGSPEAAQVFTEAARDFAKHKMDRGELLALANLRIQRFEQGDLAEALHALQRIKAIGAQSTSSELQVRALVVEGRHWIDSKSNLDQAYQALKAAEWVVEDAHGYFVKREIYNELGQLSATFGRYDEALRYFQRFLALAEEVDDPAGAALALVNLASTHHEMALAAPQSKSSREVFVYARRAVAAAQQVEIVPLELTSTRILAETQAVQNPLEALRLTKACINTASSAELFWPRVQCMWVQAYALAAQDPERALDMIHEALEMMQEASADEHTQLAFAWRYFMRISWMAESRDVAVRNGSKALAAFESLRATQGSHLSRSSVFSSWAVDYRWLAGSILDQAQRASNSTAQGNPIRARLRREQAFQVMERMRARSLLDALRVPVAIAPAQEAERAYLNRTIARLNRTLLQSSEPDKVQDILEELAGVERREMGIRPQHAAAGLRVGVAEIQAELNPDEALLSFQSGHWQHPFEMVPGGAWLMVLTRDEIKALPLPGRHQLEGIARLVVGAVGNDRVFAEVSQVAYQSLVAEAVDGLSHDVKRLVIIPDAPLNTFPFASLFVNDEDVLGDHFTVSSAPSAATWMHWRSRSGQAAQPRALVLTNPDVSQIVSSAEPIKVWQDSVAVALTDLPAAEAEASRLEDQFPGSVVLSGVHSSERQLKTQDLGQHGILHFAVHAIVDDKYSERSALVLAPGAMDEDGLLQVREISQLDLNGQLVVLASCQSALGADVAGEGVLSLARAFLAAGSQAVIGSLWPIQDAHAQVFFAAFYQSLSQAQSIGASVRAAQMMLREQGYPVEAWAGFVVVGDDSWHAESPVVSRSESWLQWLLRDG